MSTHPVTAERQSPAWTLAGVPASAQAHVLAGLLAGQVQGIPAPDAIVHICVNGRSLEALRDQLTFFAPASEILTFPAWDCMPYDRVSPQPQLMAERMRVLAVLANPKQTSQPGMRIILTTANAILQRLPPVDAMRHVSHTLHSGQKLNREALMHYLLTQGYRRAGKAMEPGEFAVRGSILDIIPPGQSEGIRIDVFGDDIESLRPFDPLTQITHGTRAQVSLYPVSEVLLNDAGIQHFREQYRELFGVGKDDPLYASISEGRPYPGMEHFLPLFYGRTSTLLDYCHNALVMLEHEATSAISARHESVHDYYDGRKAALATRSGKNSFTSGAPAYHPLPPDRFFLMEAGWEHVLSLHPHADFSLFGNATPDANTVRLDYRPAFRFTTATSERNPFDQLRDTAEAAASRGKAVLLACYSAGSRERLQTLLMERKFHCMMVENFQETKQLRGKTLGLAILPIEQGFESDKLLILSEEDVLGNRITRPRARKKQSEVFLAEAANFSEGELVVHKEHGIARFDGLVTLTVSGAAHDCLKLVYADDDKLFLPVENIEQVSRFGLEEEGVRLDKLGGASWQSRKAKLNQRIKIAAEALLKTAAERLIKRGAIVETPTGSYDDFCARFPYVETEDQARAINEVLEDLHSGKPMDRLVCGDVGFGKTEVALRAAFVVAMAARHPERSEGSQQVARDPSAAPQDDGYQVAIVTPTTLLARQHYRNFTERFRDFPVTVRQLSRMVPTKEQKDTREKLANGEVDIVIGTHALLSKQVSFKRLGLMIVDEEQHFGVVQKEKLKDLKSDVHVLTLSATPIPRTLQMALTGVRDLSLITTPPVDRLAVRSFVMPFDPVILREAMLRELHRGGKCFVVTPRIKDIADLKLQLAELVPELRLCVAHGQMPPSDLDMIMNDFYDGKYDVLLSTAIIESGLDIPTANTMIIHNAQLFGLSQLYQMRGRVGRGKTRAYAYFLLPYYKQLSKNATRRLEVMQTLDTLGAGFTLASHDMDIRGFGNLVGEEQSGHIREVGIELYQQMLEEAVAALKSETGNQKSELPISDWSPQINLGISVLIPEDYVGDLQLRLGLYRRVANMDQDADINSFAAELTDRFGPMPEEVQHLIAVLGIKLLCKKAGIERLDAGPKGAVLTFHHNAFAKPDALLAHIARNPRHLKIRPDQKLVFTHEWKETADKIAVAKKLVGEIAGLAG